MPAHCWGDYSPMMDENEYILGTHDAEIERLGLQHRVWRPLMLEVLRDAGIRAGHHVLDIGCGPGFGAIDLAEIVGPTGRVFGYERSRRFLSHLERQNAARGLSVTGVELDFDTDALPHRSVDAVWCRWLLSFVKRPDDLVRQIAAEVKPGGVAVFHEYCDYRSWRLGPSSRAFEQFVGAVMDSWKAAGGEPDIGLRLPVMLQVAGMRLERVRPLMQTPFPDNFVWEWPEAFARINLDRLVEHGFVSDHDRCRTLQALDHAKATPGHFMLTPCVLEIIARRPV